MSERTEVHSGAKLSIAVIVSVQFCPGEHGPEVKHDSCEAEAVFRLSPPLDDVPSWPPKTVAEQERAAEGALTLICAGVSEMVLSIPGSSGTSWDAPVDDDV